MSIIKVENLSKKYIIGHDRNAGGTFRYNSLRDSLAHTTRGLYQRLRHPFSPNQENTELEEFWALKDINFEIKQGDRVGIIGRNGAGKSTLLKILSRITEPTTGKITLNGRVASLLEVGTGFHPELSGRENIYLNGAILGMSRIEIKKKFDEIVDFSGVEKFLDTPVKRYSSGMYVRLAFAVAAHLEPEILLVDEVLAVGDAEFQKKCLGKMEDVSKEGRTVIFVSHNMGAVKSLCNKGILIDDGKMVKYESIDDVISAYFSNSSIPYFMFWKEGYPSTKTSLPVKVYHLSVKNNMEEVIGVLEPDKPFYINVKFKVFSDVKKFRLSLRFDTNDGQIVFGTATSDFFSKHAISVGDYSAKCCLPKNFLNVIKYNVTLVIEADGMEVVRCKNVLSFEVNSSNVIGGDYYINRLGVIRPKMVWEISERQK